MANTYINGDDLLRGVSGGERKRVTVGEMKVTPAILNCEDEVKKHFIHQKTIKEFREFILSKMNYGLSTKNIKEIFNQDIVKIKSG